MGFAVGHLLAYSYLNFVYFNFILFVAVAEGFAAGTLHQVEICILSSYFCTVLIFGFFSTNFIFM